MAFPDEDQADVDSDDEQFQKIAGGSLASEVFVKLLENMTTSKRERRKLQSCSMTTSTENNEAQNGYKMLPKPFFLGFLKDVSKLTRIVVRV